MTPHEDPGRGRREAARRLSEWRHTRILLAVVGALALAVVLVAVQRWSGGLFGA